MDFDDFGLDFGLGLGDFDPEKMKKMFLRTGLKAIIRMNEIEDDGYYIGILDDFPDLAELIFRHNSDSDDYEPHITLGMYDHVEDFKTEVDAAREKYPLLVDVLGIWNDMYKKSVGYRKEDFEGFFTKENFDAMMIENIEMELEQAEIKPHIKAMLYELLEDKPRAVFLFMGLAAMGMYVGHFYDMYDKETKFKTDMDEIAANYPHLIAAITTHYDNVLSTYTGTDIDVLELLEEGRTNRNRKPLEVLRDYVDAYLEILDLDEEELISRDGSSLKKEPKKKATILKLVRDNDEDDEEEE